MTIRVVCVFSILAIVLGGGAMLAAPGQDRPGIIVPEKVWVENRAPNEAIPVIIQAIPDSAVTTPLRVQLVGTPTVALAPGAIVPVRMTRGAWDYQSIVIPSGQDPAAVLANAGLQGWETTGHQFPTNQGTALLLKRQR